MRHVIEVEKVGPWGTLVDTIFRPLMYLSASTFTEAPQETHRWNNRSLSEAESRCLSKAMLTYIERDPTASPMWWYGLPRFHMPIIGGWREYAVIEVVGPDRSWHPGWLKKGGGGVSRLVKKGPVRLLRGPEGTHFFGIDAVSGQQLQTRCIGFGAVGQGGRFAHLPLL